MLSFVIRGLVQTCLFLKAMRLSSDTLMNRVDLEGVQQLKIGMNEVNLMEEGVGTVSTIKLVPPCGMGVWVAIRE